MNESDVKAAAWDELHNMTWDDWREYIEQWEADHPLVELRRVMNLLLAKHDRDSVQPDTAAK